MVAKNLKIDELTLDLKNPRIAEPKTQREALQQIIDDQGIKLVELAESIVNDGISPMERCLVMKDSAHVGRFVALEGNRRLAVLKLLANPNSLTSLDMKSSHRRRFEQLAKQFREAPIESIACFELKDRAAAELWIHLRHTGENDGRGIVGWSRVQQQRFTGGAPALQALDFVRKYGGLDAEMLAKLGPNFPISTLERLLATPDVRSEIGVEIKDGKLRTKLPADQVLKGLRRMVIDLADKNVRVTDLKLKPQMVDYVGKFTKGDRPDLSAAGSKVQPVEEFGKGDFKVKPAKAKGAKSRRKPDASDRRTLVPRGSPLNITNNRIADIFKELRSLKLDDHPNAIAVLLRVFIELSVDQYLTDNGMTIDFTVSGHKKFKKLKDKIKEAVAHMIVAGAPARSLKGIKSACDVSNSPLSVDLMHEYVHNQAVTPSVRSLKEGWDNAEEFLKRIWP